MAVTRSRRKDIYATLITVGVPAYFAVPAYLYGPEGLGWAVGVPLTIGVVGMFWTITRDMLDGKL